MLDGVGFNDSKHLFASLGFNLLTITRSRYRKVLVQRVRDMAYACVIHMRLAQPFDLERFRDLPLDVVPPSGAGRAAGRRRLHDGLDKEAEKC